ncbi:MAG: hypothetical protein OEZ57_14065 [Nitrospirota bacterium]|nr:hypothetical protein [Nitrospirota bacterium]MDH5586316.1 hypothetical protein [Nitrospirota bacterium]MDH5776029.1 hypothetical protein [Nitrospirota bacterium]
MKSSKVFKVGGLAVGGVLVAGMLGAGMNGTPVSWAKRTVLESLGKGTPAVQTAFYEGQSEGGTLLHFVKRPAATEPSPEDIEAKKHPSPPGKPEDVGRPSTKEEMIDHCMQDPNCRQKLQEAKKGKRPAKGRPAATGPSPEDIEDKKMGKPAMGNPQGPRSELVPLSASSLLAWLNPLNPSVAEAAGFNAFADFSRPKGQYGALRIGTFGGYQTGTYWPYIGPYYPAHTATYANSENKSFVQMVVSLPTAGFYLVEHKGGRGSTKLRHLNAGPIINAWDYTQTPCDPCYYVDIDWYDAGYHYWYFWSVQNTMKIMGGTVRSYP